MMWISSSSNILAFGAGILAGYFLSEKGKKRHDDTELAYEELNDILREKEKRIEQLESYIHQLLEKGRITNRKKQNNAENQPIKVNQDLTIIEGIGPKTEELLNKNGISNYSELADTPEEELNKILAAAGSVYLRHNPETWTKQAQLAASGNWEALKAWQNA